MSTQNYSNHTRIVPGFHMVLAFLLGAGLIASLFNMFMHWMADMFTLYIMFPLIFICAILLFWFIRKFVIAVQDRAIRAEESLRYFTMTGKAIDPRITMDQIIALRFASHDEFVALVDKAANENLSQDEIKKQIQNWRPDEHRA